MSNKLIYGKMLREELTSCALLAAEAFYDYEYFSIYVPDEKRRHRCLDAMIQSEFRANWNKAAVEFITAKENGRIVAVAQLCAPDYQKPSDLEYIRTGWLSVMIKGGMKEVNAWNAMEKQASALCHGLKAWYLSLLTVAKSYEGQSLGSRVLNEYLGPHVRESGGKVLSLFTNSEQNCRFYEKNGFSLFDEKRFEYGGKSIGSWSYRRDVLN